MGVKIVAESNAGGLVLTCTYYGHEADYPKYDNYDAINVNKVAQIPGDYYGPMGVPITFMDKYNPADWELIDHVRPKLAGKYLYQRIIIRRRRPLMYELLDVVSPTINGQPVGERLLIRRVYE